MIFPPESMTSIWRPISYSRASRMKWNEFTLYFCFELFLAARTHADVGIAAEGAFFPVAVANAGVEDDLLQASQIFVGLVGRREVGLTDDFDQGHAGAVEIDGRFLFGVGEAFVQALTGVFFEVDAGDADFLLVAFEGTS